jgi:hypothetical protein
MLHAKIDELNACKPSTSTVNHVSICTRCRDVNVDAIHDHLALIKQQNDHIAQLTSKINEHEIENKNLNLLEACSIIGDALALRMALASNRETMSSLMHLKDCLILLRVRLPWFRITRVTFYILLVILSTKLGEFILGSLTLALIMLLCIRVRHLVLGNPLMLNCLKRNLLLHQMSLLFLSAFRPRGVPRLTSKLSLCVLALMGRRETEHKGGRNSKGEPAAFVLSCAQGGCACSRGLQAFAWERERARARALCVGPFSRAANLLVREPWTFLL